ncbi:MAG: GNAT family N-acetyltransferase [Nocardioidaceae bacterium]|nr:GNAT family N-acetyltransferase [Nocardioidaceae bacterium]
MRRERGDLTSLSELVRAYPVISSGRGRITRGVLLLRIERVGFLDADVQTLVAEVQAEYVVRYGGPDTTPMDDTVFDPPAGAIYVGYVKDLPVALGGWRSRPDVVRLGGNRAAEIKRMYVASPGRRQGLARALLTHLERTAAESGADVMILETGLVQPEAIALYESSGYEPVEKFGYYAWSPISRCYAKRL